MFPLTDAGASTKSSLMDPVFPSRFHQRIITKLTSCLLTLAAFGALTLPIAAQAESLPPLKDGKSPQRLDEVWAGYDPAAEPIEAEICKEWEEDRTVLRSVRYCIGTFKGQKSWMAALYGFPAGQENLPAIVQIHGGGGRASKDACIANARRGYATISLNWRADDRYLKENGLPDSAQTDWGAIEGRQVPESRGIEPNNDTRYDPVPSGRNGGYFLRTLAARRALTFLQQQPEVDGDHLGVDGHSMGGVITLQTAAYPRLSLRAMRGSLPEFKRLAWKEVSAEAFFAHRPFQLGEAIDQDGKARLRLEQADRISGRSDDDLTSFKWNSPDANEDYQQGLLVHSPSEVSWFLKGVFSTFHATLVPGYQASVAFEVHGDGEVLFESKRMTGKSVPEDIHVDVSEIQELRLVVTEGGNGWGGDCVLWANPLLTIDPEKQAK